MKRVLIIGANGFVGSAFWNHYHEQGANPLGTSYRPSSSFHHFDLKEPNLKLLSLDPSEFSHGLLTGGITRLHECEKSPEKTFEYNVSAIVSLACQLEEMGIQPVIPSSDYVFDGLTGNYSEEDKLNPLNLYGKQKQILETLIQRLCKNYLILRLSKVFSLGVKDGKTLIDEMVHKLGKGETVLAAKDQIFTPIFLQDVVLSIDRLMSANAHGIFHICSSEKISRYELGCKIASILKVDRELVRPIVLDDLKESFKRPKRTDMSCRKLIRCANYIPRNITCFLEAPCLMNTGI